MLLDSGSVAKGSSSSGKLPKYSTSSSGAGERRGPMDRSRRPVFVGLLLAIKLCFSLAIFLFAHFLQEIWRQQHRDQNQGAGVFAKWGPLLQSVAFINIISGFVFIFAQRGGVDHLKPFITTTPHMTPWNGFRLLRHGVILLMLTLFWLHALLISGPFKTIIIASHYNYTLAGILSGFFVAKYGARLRGGVLFVVGIMVLLLFEDVDVNKSGAIATSSPSLAGEDIEQPFLSNNSIGVMTLLVYLMVKLGFNAMSKTLSMEMGSSKRLNAFSTLISGLLSLLMVIIDLCTGGRMIPLWSNFIPLIFITLFGFILNYYVDEICLKRMEAWQVARIGTIATHVSALLYSLILVSTSEVPSVATLVSFAMICMGVWAVTTSERASGGGNLIGFSTDGLPLFNFSSHFSSSEGDGRAVGFGRRLFLWTASFYREIQEDGMSRRIFAFFLLTLAFTSVEFVYGAIANSLGLITDAFHMLFDAMAIFIGLWASVVSRWKPSPTFPFGYGRVEVLSGFLNAFFLLVVACCIAMEALTRLWSPPLVDGHQTLTISVIGLCVNLIGIYVFRNGSGIAEHSRLHDNANVRGVFLHILADTVGSIGVIISSLLIKHFSLLIADPLCSLVIALFITWSALPLLKDTGRILLLSAPRGMERNLQQVVLQILSQEGVKGYQSLRFWSHAPQILTGAIHLQITDDANEQKLIRKVNNLFQSIGFGHFTTQVEKDEFSCQVQNNTGSEMDSSSNIRVEIMK